VNPGVTHLTWLNTDNSVRGRVCRQVVWKRRCANEKQCMVVCTCVSWDSSFSGSECWGLVQTL